MHAHFPAMILSFSFEPQLSMDNSKLNQLKLADLFWKNLHVSVNLTELLEYLIMVIL